MKRLAVLSCVICVVTQLVLICVNLVGQKPTPGKGYVDVQRIFKQKPCCYGQPGNSWAPQAFPSLASWGVGLYLDEATHVGLNGQPFYYGGLLNIFNTKEGPQLRPNDEWTNIEESK